MKRKNEETSQEIERRLHVLEREVDNLRELESMDRDRIRTLERTVVNIVTGRVK